MPEIPTEIIEQIVDELVDRKSLVACLSVSRAFHSRALYHLFQTVRLATESDFHRFIYLCDISPAIPSLVQSLKIFFRSTAPHLPSLPNVTSLHIKGYLNGDWQTNFLATTSLTLEQIIFPTAQSFRSWICAYPCLTSLSLMSVVVHRPTLVGPFSLAQGPPLKFLSIAYVSDSVYGMFIGSSIKAISCFALHGICKIRHTISYPYDAAGIHGILAVARDTLRELDMNAEPLGPQIRQVYDGTLDISQVPTINYWVSCRKVSFMDSIRWLSYYTHPKSDGPASMERLVVHLDLPGWQEKLTFFQSLEPLDTILTDPRYCVLKVVQFNLRRKERNMERGMRHAIHDDVLMALPKLRAAGRLILEDELV
ncbi:hypothetical protein EDD85DRAFT_953186 [Armillaria nabsnona]|nr:hypothetical protein EDD85DRAFT_953186 [Armillaria nabsnona]